MRGRTPKTLLEHIRDGTFRACRHAHLLDGDLLGGETPRTLSDLQFQYRNSPWPRVRAAVAVQFEKIVRRRRDPRRRLTRQQIKLAQVGPLGALLDDRHAIRHEMYWVVWDRLHGADWRRHYDIPLTRDLDKHLPPPQAKPPPNPPGWHLLRTEDENEGPADDGRRGGDSSWACSTTSTRGLM